MNASAADLEYILLMRLALFSDLMSYVYSSILIILPATGIKTDDYAGTHIAKTPLYPTRAEGHIYKRNLLLRYLENIAIFKYRYS